MFFPVNKNLLLITYYLPLTTHHSPLTTHYSPLTTYHLPLSQFLDSQIVIRINTNIRRDMQRLFDDLAGGQIGVVDQGLGRGLRVRAARTDGHNAVLRLEHVAPARDDEQRSRIAHDDERLEVAEVFVSAPVLREFHGGALEIAGEAFEFLFEAFEEGERIGGRSGEASEDLTLLADAPDLAGVALHDGLPHRHLTIAHDDELAPLLHGENGGGVPSGFRRHAGNFLTVEQFMSCGTRRQANLSIFDNPADAGMSGPTPQFFIESED